MRVTMTGATGRIGTRLVARAARARRRGHRALAQPGAGARGARRRGGRLAARGRAGARRGARGPRRRDAPRRRGRRPALERRGQAAAARARASWARATSSPACARPSRGPAALVSASAVGWYGPRGDEPVDRGRARRRRLPRRRSASAWEREAAAAEALGVRVVRVRTGVVLDKGGGALAKMLPFFKLGVGGPVAGGRQYMPWIHVDDLVALYLAALDGGTTGAAPVNAHRARARDQQGVLARRSAARCTGRRSRPCPGFAVRAALRRDGRHRRRRPARRARARAARSASRFAHPELDEALRSALAADCER